jgi:hypothetical protein
MRNCASGIPWRHGFPGLHSDRLSPAGAHPGMMNDGDNSHRIGFMESLVQFIGRKLRLVASN